MLHTFLAGEEESESLVACKYACDKYEECRFISIDEINEICILFKRANTVKAKRHTGDQLLQKFGVTTNVESWQSDAALVKDGATMDDRTSSDLEAASTCDKAEKDSTPITYEQFNASKKEFMAKVVEVVEDDDKNAKTEEVSNDPLGGVVLSFLKKAAFTASVQGKITLAIHLSASTWGLVDFSLTMTVAAAIRKGDVSHPGLYITVDLSAGSKTQAGKLLTESAEKASKVINGAKASVDKAAKIDGKVGSKIAEEIKLFQLDSSEIEETFKTETKINARMQIYVQNIENFGFKWR